MNLFERIRHEIAKFSAINEMATLTTSTNNIPGYANVKIGINASSEEPALGALQEHDPPHFHLLAQGFDISVSLPDYELIAVGKNKNNSLVIRNSKKPSWDMSGQIQLKKAFEKWLVEKHEYGTNKQSLFITWNINNPTLTQAYFNFEQTKRLIENEITGYLSAGITVNRKTVKHLALGRSYISSSVLEQVLDNLNLR